MPSPIPRIPRITLEDFNMSQFELCVMQQGLALVKREGLYDKYPDKNDIILKLAMRLKRSVANDV